MNLAFPAKTPLHRSERARRVTAVLGPTNTGKTHYAVERMLAHPTGIIGLPLRLLAREVYNRVVERAGVEAVALITGEEKIKPKHPRYWVSTVEAMPRDLDVDFVAIDEIQLAANLDRGHVFTNRLLNRRGRNETLLIGALTMQPAIERLLPGVTIVSRPRLSQLTFAGERKLSRLPPKSAIVAFSAEEVYAIAELIRRQRGGAAVVLGALSPRTRNAQVALFQNGDVDHIIATDAIGMGLNLNVDHIAFAGDRKFDGWQYRRLNPAEYGQIAGRAGRYLTDGTFGTTGRCPPLEPELVEALEDHRFDPVELLQWRNADLDFSTIEALQASLELQPAEAGLTRAPLAEDVLVLDIASHDSDVRKQTKTRADIQRLWEVCQIPDYRKLSPAAHADLVLTLYGFVVRAGWIPDDWFQQQLATFDRTDGDIDTLSARIAQVRTWNFIANRPDWLRDPEHWQGVTRQVEDKLSDALHERLAHRFVDRRTSVLMRRLRENAMLEAEVTATGDVLVEAQHIGHLHGFRFTPDPHAGGEAARALNAAALKALASEIDGRALRVHEAVDEAFVLANDGTLRWLGEAVGKLAAGDHVLKPKIRVLADDHLAGASLDMVRKRLDLWIAQHVKKLLGTLDELEAGEGLDGIARGIAFQIAESLGVLERSRVAAEMKTLPQEARGALRKFGVRFGAYHLYLPLLLKPAPRALAAQLWVLRHGGIETVKGLDDVPHLAASGRTSFPADKDVPKGLYLAAGFRVGGERAVRVDILERLADLIRPAISYRPGVTPGKPPPGSADADGFVVTVSMTSLAGCSGEAFASILRSLGYVSESRKGPAITVPLLAAAPQVPLNVAAEKDAAATAHEANAEVPVESEAGAETTADTREDSAGAEIVVAADAFADDAPTAAAATEENVAEHIAAPETPEAAALPDNPSAAPVEASAEDAAAAAGEAVIAAETETAAETAAAPEVPPIEVWHPQRHHHAGKRPERQRGRPHRREAGAGAHAEAGQGTALTAVPAESPMAAVADGGAPSPRREDFRRPGRDNRPGGDRGRTDSKPDGRRPEGKPGEGRGRFQGKPPGQGRRDNDRDTRRGDRPFASTEKPPQRERLPDPNSPFAKLLALKVELEARAKKDNS